MLSHKAEQWGHKGGPDVGTGHLYTHDGGGVISAKMRGGGMEQAGINGGAAQTCQNETGRNGVIGRNKEEEDANGDNSLSNPDHGPVP